MVAVSEYVRQCAHRRLGYPLARLSLVYNPVDLGELARPPARARAELLAELGLAPDTQLLLAVGRVAPQKGMLHAVRALARLVERFPRARLVCIGSKVLAPYVARVTAEAERLGLARHVVLTGPRRDVADWLHACDLFVFPSLFEGLGIALCEAMVAGRACVASDVGPIREFLRDGVEGRLVAPADPDALADALAALLAAREERARLGQAAAARASALFEPHAAAAAHQAIYRALLAPRG
jgi:glycosyltransferase involved in cell wall biosynthesis